MRLLLIRHGDPDYEQDALTDRGKREAEALAKRLVDEPIDACYLSPLGRAQETAAPTLQTKGLTGTTCEWLREFKAPIYRPDKHGALGITWDWMPADWTPEDRFYDVATWTEVPIMQDGDVAAQYGWVCGELDTLLASHGYERDGRLYRVKKASTKTLCFFCHYGVAMVLLSRLLSISPMLLWHGTVMAPASVTELYTEERQEGKAYFRMTRYADTAHLIADGLGGNTMARFRETYDDATGIEDRYTWLKNTEAGAVKPI